MIECLQEALKEVKPESTLDLKKWTDSWLKQAGPSQILCSYEAADGNLTIKQDFPQYADKAYREQALEITLVFVDKDQKTRSVPLPNMNVAA